MNKKPLYFLLLTVFLTACPKRREAPAPVSYGFSSPVTSMEAQPEHQPAPQIEKIVIVKEGQNLKSLANDFNVSEQEIIKHNTLPAPYYIYPGQNIKIPMLSSSKNFLKKKSEVLVHKVEDPLQQELEKEFTALDIEDNSSSNVPSDLQEEVEKLDTPLPLPLPKPFRKKTSVAEREQKLENQFEALEESKEDLKKSLPKKEKEIFPQKRKTQETVSEVEEIEEIPQKLKELSSKITAEKKKKDSKEKKRKLREEETKEEEEETAPPSVQEESADSETSLSPEQKKEITPPLKFIWPTQGKVALPFNQKEGKIKNDGINITAPKGTPIVAVADGKVMHAKNTLEGFGNLILIKHKDGWMSSYGHCQKIFVKEKQKVKQGEQIGLLGNTGSVNKPQLHFELRKNSTKLDPLLYLD